MAFVASHMSPLHRAKNAQSLSFLPAPPDPLWVGQGQLHSCQEPQHHEMRMLSKALSTWSWVLSALHLGQIIAKW